MEVRKTYCTETCLLKMRSVREWSMKGTAGGGDTVGTGHERRGEYRPGSDYSLDGAGSRVVQFIQNTHSSPTFPREMRTCCGRLRTAHSGPTKSLHPLQTHPNRKAPQHPPPEDCRLKSCPLPLLLKHLSELNPPET